MKKQSFMTGAFLLAVATGLGKIFSAIFKIPLDRLLLHVEGMAVFNGAYNVYTFFYAAATAGIPLAISRMIASAETKDEEGTIITTAWTSLSVFLGVVSLAVFMFSDSIASLIGMNDSALAFRVMSPAIFFCGITASFRGYFQGRMTMLPSASSQVADSFFRFIAGFALAYVFLEFPIGIRCAGAISGVPLGAAVSALILLASFKASGERLPFIFSKKVLWDIVRLSVPITLITSLYSIFNMADTLSVVPFLKFLSHPGAQTAFGALSRSATLYALPVSIATAVASSALPAVAESTKTGDTKALRKDSSMALRLTLIISIPCTAGFMALPEGILNFLYDNSVNYITLAFIAPSAVFLSAGEVIASILQGMGRTRATVFSALAAVGAKIILNVPLMYLLGVNGAAVATSLAYFIFAASLYVYTVKTTPVKFSITGDIAKPLLCGFLCFGTAYLLSPYLPTPVTIVAAAIVYIPSVFMTKAVRFDEINQIFEGHKIEG